MRFIIINFLIGNSIEFAKKSARIFSYVDEYSFHCIRHQFLPDSKTFFIVYKMEVVVETLSKYKVERKFNFSSILDISRSDDKEDGGVEIEVVVDGQVSTRNIRSGVKRAYEATGKEVSDLTLIVKSIDRVRSRDMVGIAEQEIRQILDKGDLKYSISRSKADCTMYVTTTREIGSFDVTIDVDLCVQILSDNLNKNGTSTITAQKQQQKPGSVNVVSQTSIKHPSTNIVVGTIWTRLTFSALISSNDSKNSETINNNNWTISISVTSHHLNSVNKASTTTTTTTKSSTIRRRRGVSGEEDLEDGPLLPKKNDLDDEDSQRKTRALQMYRKENLAIPVIYFMLGMTIKLPLVALREYMRKVLQVDPDTQTMVLSVLATLPWHLKLIFAFLSDSVPIGGQRRRPYIYLGIVTCGAMWTLFGALPTHPGLGFTSLLLFCATFGLVMIDVNVDAVVVERVSWEKGDAVGT